MKVIVFLPVKGNSERISNKNTKLLDGKPLFLYTLEKLCDANLFDKVVLDTESKYVESLASYLKNFEILKRDPELATNSTNGNKLLLNEAKYYDADIYVQILCTSPFIKLETIENAINIVKSGEYDSAITVTKEKLYTWDNENTPNYDHQNIPNSINLADTIIETMGLYVISKEALSATKRRIGNKVKHIEVEPLEAIDVNYPHDFKLAHYIAAGLRENKRKLMINTKQFLSSAVLSDALDELGYQNQVIRGLTSNIKDAKIYGVAKTLKLRNLEEGEDYRGIYSALKSYNYTTYNDIIIVQNDASEYAYFGEINASMAIRSGVSGIIIDGMTRDNSEVSKMEFSVFSKGFVCQDVKGRVTTDKINQEIKVQGIKVFPNDVIFADNEGVIIIPKKIEKAVIEKAMIAYKKEKKILIDIASGVSSANIISQYGQF